MTPILNADWEKVLLVVVLKVGAGREVRSPEPDREKKLRALEAMASGASKGFYSSVKCNEGQTEGQRAKAHMAIGLKLGGARLPAAQGPWAGGLRRHGQSLLLLHPTARTRNLVIQGYCASNECTTMLSVCSFYRGGCRVGLLVQAEESLQHSQLGLTGTATNAQASTTV